MSSDRRPPISLPFYYGWVVVALAFLTMLTGAGVRSSPSVLIHPLETEFGWSRAAIASVISVNLLLFGVASPVSGWLLDRFGARRVMLGSLALLIVGVSGTMAMTEFWQFFLVWGVIVGIGAGGVGSVLSAAVGSRWFVAKRGLALGILGSASSTGQLIFIPLFMVMITFAGWRMGSMALIVVAMALLPAIYVWMRDDPSDVGLLPLGVSRALVAAADGAAPVRRLPTPGVGVSLRTVLGNTTFWLLAASFFVCGGTSVGLIGTHLIPHEIDHGIPQVTAASVVGVMGGLNFVGTIFSGWIIDRIEPRKWLAFVYALRGLSLFILPLVRDVNGLFVFAIFYGLGWFATVPPTMAIAADTFGTANVGRVYGWIFLAHQIGAAIMATTAGVLRTSLGDYRLAFLSGGVVALLAAGLAFQARPRPPRSSSGPVAPEAAGA